MAGSDRPSARPAGVARPPPAASSTVLHLIGPIDIPALCELVRTELRAHEGPVVCDVSALADPDAATVDALARLQLTARRNGRCIRLRGAGDELQALLALMGLGDVLPCEAGSVEPSRQAEQREQTRGVQEEADPADPPARELEDLERPRLEPALGARLVLPERR